MAEEEFLEELVRKFEEMAAGRDGVFLVGPRDREHPEELFWTFVTLEEEKSGSSEISLPQGGFRHPENSLQILHEIQPGQSIEEIAKLYGVSVGGIKEDNSWLYSRSDMSQVVEIPEVLNFSFEWDGYTKYGDYYKIVATESPQESYFLTKASEIVLDKMVEIFGPSWNYEGPIEVRVCSSDEECEYHFQCYGSDVYPPAGRIEISPTGMDALQHGELWAWKGLAHEFAHRWGIPDLNNLEVSGHDVQYLVGAVTVAAFDSRYEAYLHNTYHGYHRAAEVWLSNRDIFRRLREQKIGSTQASY